MIRGLWLDLSECSVSILAYLFSITVIVLEVYATGFQVESVC